MDNALSLVPAIGELYRQLGITEVISEQELQAGLHDFEVELLALAAEVHAARTRGIRLSDAVRDDFSFPHLHRAHCMLDDILQASVPPELQAWARRALATPMSPLVDELQNQIARAAVGETANACAARFVLFQLTRVTTKCATWMTNGATEKVGATDTLTDEIAEDHVDNMIELVTALPPDIRPFQQLVAGAMIELTAVVDELREALRTTKREIAEHLQERAAIEMHLREIEPVEAVLIRNELHEVLGEQYMPIEELRRAHPVLLGGHSRAALDQRAKRLRDRVRERGSGGVPRRGDPSLYQFLSSLQGDKS